MDSLVFSIHPLHQCNILSFITFSWYIHILKFLFLDSYHNLVGDFCTNTKLLRYLITYPIRLVYFFLRVTTMLK